MRAASKTFLSWISPPTSSASSRMPSMAGQSTWHLEHLLDALHVSLGLPKMGFECGLELGRTRLGDHVGQCADDALLRIVDVLQLVDEQVIHRCDVLGKKTHAHDSLRSRRLGVAAAIMSQREPRAAVCARR